MTMHGLMRAALFLGAGLCCVTSAIADDGDVLDKVREHGTLHVAVYENFPPYSYLPEGSTTYVGVDVDLANALAKSLGAKVDLRAIRDGEDSDDDLRNHLWKGTVVGGSTVDLMMHVGADPQYVKRQSKVLIFGVYLHDTVAIALRSSHISNFTTLDQLKNKKTAVELGSLSDMYLTGAFGGLLRDSLVRKPSAQEAVDAFVKDEVDAVIAPKGELQGLLQLEGSKDIVPLPIKFAGMYRSTWDIGIAVKADAPKLKAALDEALTKMESDGELAAIYSHYGLEYTAPVAETSTGVAATR